ncbi:MAG: alpha-amylase [Sterolibacteriaceae bacterium]|nr:alpha-amylase [Sterolibacteriaceae bacterium]MBK9084390.1 alpha-amylase [Sterolibacteriaceae bacterium]
MNDQPSNQTPHLYNLYPRLAGPVTTWPAHAARAAAMEFDWLYLNPWHYPGFSGSCYAIKDYSRVDPRLLPEGHLDKHYEDVIRSDGGLGVLRETLAQVRAAGLRPIMDLVINHTSRDSPLTREHPEWFVRDASGAVESPSAIDPDDASKVTVWGDLAEIDNAGSPDRDRLWQHWIGIVERGVQLGFEGFRCDAAYKVPAELWRELIGAATRLCPGVLFFGEILGARLEEIEAMRDAGLHFSFNSSMWWDFAAPWCLDQQHDQRQWIRSVSFPESHDTPRLWSESGGSLALQKQRYAFAAAFASGLMMPVGYEFGFQRRIDVVTTQACDYETPNADLSEFVARVNRTRRAHRELASEWTSAVGPLDRATLLLEKQADDSLGYVAINKDRDAGQVVDLPEDARGRRVIRICRDSAPSDETSDVHLALEPAEVVYLVSAE